VRAALDHGEPHVVDQAGQPPAGLVQWQDLVRVALQDQQGHVDLGQADAEVGGYPRISTTGWPAPWPK
jgi:hypothetical protein